MTNQMPIKSFRTMIYSPSTTLNLVFHDKHRIAQNLHACKFSTTFCDLVKIH